MLFSVTKEEIQVNPYEVLRYLGYKKDLIRDDDVELACKHIEKAREYINAKAVYERFSVKVYGDGNIEMPYGLIKSESLTRNLEGCREIFIFAATIGANFDRMMQRARASSMSEAAILQAVGAAFVEEVCDILNRKLDREAFDNKEKLRPRFSPGYGDLELSNQTGVFKVLEPYKYAGITLNDSLLMSPEKSVTAIIGIEQ